MFKDYYLLAVAFSGLFLAHVSREFLSCILFLSPPTHTHIHAVFFPICEMPFVNLKKSMSGCVKFELDVFDQGIFETLLYLEYITITRICSKKQNEITSYINSDLGAKISSHNKV